MAIRTLLRFRNLDSTKDINDRFSNLFNAGVYSGGDVVPVASQLKVDITPWEVVSSDGMVVIETSDTTRLNTPAGQTTVVAVKVEYIENNDPVVDVVAIEESAFNILVDKDKYVIFAHVEVPAGATQVLNSFINFTPRDTLDKIGRSVFRGHLTNAGLLPTNGNRVGDFYVVVDGVGGPPNLHAWDGSQWRIMTDFVQLSADLSAHRQNLFTDEKHLTDDEKDAVQGTSGNAVNDTNRFVDNADTRLPTQDENDALIGSHGSPSTSNLYITQDFPLALTNEEFSGSAPANPYVELVLTDGPFFVGTSGVGSANKYFQFYDSVLKREYIRTDGQPVNVTGIFLDSGLTNELDPSTNPDVDPFGFLTNTTIFVEFDTPPDTAFRLLYGKRFTLNDIPTDALLRRSIPEAQTSADAITTIENIKGRSFSDTPPENEQNINLRSDIVDTREYLGSSFFTDKVVGDFTAVDKVPDFDRGTGTQDFIENIGIPANYTFENSGQEGFSYDNTTGTVTFDNPVALGSVVAGNVFIDGDLSEYKVISTNGTDEIVIQKRSGLIPKSINTTVTDNAHGSVKPDNNPRRINLSNLQHIVGTERIDIREILPVPGELHPATGNVAFEIVTPLRSRSYKEPRIRLYGGFLNQDAGKRRRVVAKGTGRILLTGFFTDLYLLAKPSASAPSVTVYLDGDPTGTPVDISRSGDAVDFGNPIDVIQKPIALVNNISDLVPHTVEIVVDDAVDPLFMYGFELVRRVFSNSLTLPGRAFVQADLYKKDSLSTVVTPSVISQGRGVVARRYVDRDLTLTTDSYELTDFDGTLGVPSGTAVSGTPNFTVTSGLAKFEFYKNGDVVKLITASDEEIKQILSIGPSPGQVVFTTNVTSSGTAALLHVASTQGDSEDPNKEYRRYKPEDLGIDQTNEFSVPTPTVLDRTFTTEDGITSLAGVDLSFVTTGVSGVDRALNLSTGSSNLRFRSVSTRFDLVTANDIPVSFDLSIDGSPPETINLTGNGIETLTLFTNARYQTHEININNASGLNISGFILYEPRLPDIIEGTSLSQQNIIARYAAGNEFDGDTIPTGVVAADPHTHIGIFVDGSGVGTPWDFSLDFVENPSYGKYITTDQEGSYYEFEFYGEGFEIEYNAGPDRGRPIILLNGVVANNTNFAATFRGMDSATGEVDMYNATNLRRRFGISSLSFNRYVVRVEVQTPRERNVSSTGFHINISSVYLINSNGTLSVTHEEGVKREFEYGFNSLRDLRKFEAADLPVDVQFIERKVLDKPRDVISVGFESDDDFTVDGVEDDVQIQSAVNAALSSSIEKQVIIKPGSYDIRAQISVPQDVEVISLGADLIKSGFFAGPNFLFELTGPNVMIKDFDLTGSGFTDVVNNNSQTGSRILNCKFPTPTNQAVRNVVVNDTFITTIEHVIPVGTVLDYAGSTPPPGFLACDGSALSRSLYQALFDTLGEAWGEGDGVNTFNLPMLAGYFTRGINNMNSGLSADPDFASRVALFPGGATGDNVGSYQNTATRLPDNPFGTDDQGTHLHTLDPAGTHDHNIDPVGNHAHNYSAPFSNQTNLEPLGPSVAADEPEFGSTTGQSGAHTHNADPAGDHTHIANPAGIHSHTVTLGGDAESRPPNAYMLKIIKF